MAASTLVKKLGIKPGQRILLMNAPEGFRDLLGELPEETTITTTKDGSFDVVHLFVASQRDIDTLAPQAIEAVKPGGLLWISYPKKSSKVKTDIDRDRGWDTVTNADYLGVTQIAIDETWSALRFRPRNEIKKLTRTTFE